METKKPDGPQTVVRPLSESEPVKKWPKWVWFVPFLFTLKLPHLNRYQWRLLGLVGFASLFNRYDLAILQMALPQIQTSLGITTTHLNNNIAIIQAGALPAFLLMLAADRVGRRRLLIITIVGYTVMTGLTAFSTSVAMFVATQFFSRMFVTAEMLLSAVVIAEEFPPDARGRGVGALAAMAATGFGLAALFFAFVDVMPFGWRTLYFIGFVPLVILSSLRRNLPETAQFQKQQAARAQKNLDQEEPFMANLQPMIDLVRAYPGRFWGISLLVFIYTFATEVAFFYDPTYLQDAHGWQPWQISMLTIVGGFLALFGNTLAGNVGDLMGRKRATILFLVCMPIFISVFYNAAGWFLPVIWAIMLFAMMGINVSVDTMSTELYPTSYRSTAAGARAIVAALGAALSQVVHGLIFGFVGSQWTAVSIMSIFIFLTPFIVARLPETSGRSLDETAPER
ncbi:MAG: MFS transporter [Chloroflexi bacterium]|nr:MFS transporter [Chloroflexota bacterium]